MHLRTAAQLLAMAIICFSGCWLIDLAYRSRPSVISGKVADGITGKPLPFTEVRRQLLNSAPIEARTNAQGEFTILASSPGIYFLFTGEPGQLLQATFGQTIAIYRPGDQSRGVIVPAIPATHLSGTVYADDGRPLAACHVAALTLDETGSADEGHFREIEVEDTSSTGSYTFTRLGADRYFVVAIGNKGYGEQPMPKLSWVPLIYPQAKSISTAQEITLHPGEWRSEVDFHMRRERSYSVEGRVILSDPSSVLPGRVYSNDLRMVRVDRGLGGIRLADPFCNWRIEAGTFRCDSVLPGQYVLKFDLESGKQAARIDYTVRAKARQSPLIIRLQNAAASASVESNTSTGFLDLEDLCRKAAADKATVQVLVSGRHQFGRACYFMTQLGKADLELPEGTYSVTAFNAGFVWRRGSALSRYSKMETLLGRHGVSVQILAGKTTKVNPTVISTHALIKMALDSLR